MTCSGRSRSSAPGVPASGFKSAQPSPNAEAQPTAIRSRCSVHEVRGVCNAVAAVAIGLALAEHGVIRVIGVCRGCADPELTGHCQQIDGRALDRSAVGIENPADDEHAAGGGFLACVIRLDDDRYSSIGPDELRVVVCSQHASH